MGTDLVSIIMPSYKCGRFIEKSIRSIKVQTYKNWELIVVDDCSGDETVEKVLERPIGWISNRIEGTINRIIAKDSN